MKTKLFVIAALAAFAVQVLSAQDAKPKKAAGGKKDAAAAAPATPGPDTATTLTAAADALGMRGGPQRVTAYTTLEYWATGTTNALGQASSPDKPWPAFKATVHASLSYAVP